MLASVITRFGEPAVLQIREVDKPCITGPNQVLIKVYAVGVNRPDVFQRKGNYPAPEGVVQNIPGLEVAGIIEEVGTDVKRLTVRAKVMALVAGAGYAEYVVVDSGSVLEIPDNLSLVQAAALPETLFTVWHNVFQRGKLVFGEKFLVHGGAGGIGSTAIQLARLFGAKVYTTVSSAEKSEFARKLGAVGIVNYNEEDFGEKWPADTFDVVLDSIGGDYFSKNIHLLKTEGRLVYINAMAGAKVELNIMKLMQKRLVLTGSTLRNREDQFKALLAREIEENVLPLISTGNFKVPIHRVFPLQDAAEAHALMESSDFLGKLVLQVAD